LIVVCPTNTGLRTEDVNNSYLQQQTGINQSICSPPIWRPVHL